MTWRQQPHNERVEALQTACLKKHWLCVKVLVRLRRFTERDLNAKCDKYGRTVLHIAAINGESEVVRVLLRAGASHATVSKNGHQPLHDACIAGHAEAAAALLEFADPVAEVCDANGHSKDNGRTPLELAQAYGRMQVCDLLKAHGIQT
jgi:ankyrin repeat protein